MTGGGYYRLSDVNKDLAAPLPAKNAVATVMSNDAKPPSKSPKKRGALPQAKLHVKPDTHQTLAGVMYPPPGPPPPAPPQPQPQPPAPVPEAKKLQESPPAQKACFLKDLDDNFASGMSGGLEEQSKPKRAAVSPRMPAQSPGKHFLTENSGLDGLFNDEANSTTEEKPTSEISGAVSYSDPKYQTIALLPGQYEPFQEKQTKTVGEVVAVHGEKITENTPLHHVKLCPPRGGPPKQPAVADLPPPAKSPRCSHRKKKPSDGKDAAPGEKTKQHKKSKWSSNRDKEKEKGKKEKKLHHHHHQQQPPPPENVKPCPPLAGNKILHQEQPLHHHQHQQQQPQQLPENVKNCPPLPGNKALQQEPPLPPKLQKWLEDPNCHDYDPEDDDPTGNLTTGKTKVVVANVKDHPLQPKASTKLSSNKKKDGDGAAVAAVVDQQAPPHAPKKPPSKKAHQPRRPHPEHPHPEHPQHQQIWSYLFGGGEENTTGQPTPPPPTQPQPPAPQPVQPASQLPKTQGSQQPAVVVVGLENLPPNVKHCPPKGKTTGPGSGNKHNTAPGSAGKKHNVPPTPAPPASHPPPAPTANLQPPKGKEKKPSERKKTTEKPAEKPKKKAYVALDELDDDDDDWSEPPGPAASRKPSKTKKDIPKPQIVVNCPPLPAAVPKPAGQTEKSDSDRNDNPPPPAGYEMMDPSDRKLTPKPSDSGRKKSRQFQK